MRRKKRRRLNNLWSYKMAVKVQRHIKKITAAHGRHKKKVLSAFHKIRKDARFYKPGKAPSKAAMPKSMPRQPAGLNSKGAGLWSFVKRGWTHVKKLFHSHKDKIIAEGKKQVGAYVRKHGAKVRDYAIGRAKEVASRVHAKAEAHVRSYIQKGEAKVRQVASKVDGTIDKYLPKGSGWVSDMRNKGRRSRQMGGSRGWGSQSRQGAATAPLSRFGRAISGFGGRMIGGLARTVGRAVMSRARAGRK